MKKIIVGIMCIAFLAIMSCATIPVQNPVCPQDDSWICEQSAKINVQPETVYGWIYSASAIAVISDAISIKEICEFEGKIADWYVSVYPVSYNRVISEVAKQAGLIHDAKKAMLIGNILNQNLALYSNEALISEADDTILKKGHAKFRKDMLCN